MSIEKCTSAGSADLDAVASLLDGSGDLAKALTVPERDTQELIDLAKYQHQVLSEIAETIDSSRGFAELQRETIRTKCESSRAAVQQIDRKSTRLNSSHLKLSRMPSSA